jgi:hypothetical protein
MDVPDLSAGYTEAAEAALAVVRARNAERLQGAAALKLIEACSPQASRAMPEGATFSTYA